jgi:hypothetical protein
MPSQPTSAALTASAADWMPLSTNGRPPEIRFHCAISHGIFAHVCALPCHTFESIHLPESAACASAYLRMNTGSLLPISLPTSPGG